jgi:hypothetical protein
MVWMCATILHINHEQRCIIPPQLRLGEMCITSY